MRMMRKNSVLRKYMSSILLFLLFETVAIMLWIAKDNLFYLLNFSYIGGCLALGTALFTAGKHYARHFVQLTVGSYMLLYLGIISCDNMQIEGFWLLYWIFCLTNSRKSPERKSWAFCVTWCLQYPWQWFLACFWWKSQIWRKSCSGCSLQETHFTILRVLC